MEPNNELRIVETADGSNTIFNPQVGENYHSRHGALQESRHVFVNSGLAYFLDKVHGGSPAENKLGDAPVSILEVGFGTGLNFLLSAGYCNQSGTGLHYCGIEAYPLSTTMIAQTGYQQYIPAATWQKFLAIYPDALLAPVQMDDHCQLEIAHIPLLDFHREQQYDIIYFDAFAAAHQPEMWDDMAITHTLQYLKPGGVFVTYAITGNLKRALKALGCKVEKAKGAPGKREMLRAVKMV